MAGRSNSRGSSRAPSPSAESPAALRARLAELDQELAAVWSTWQFLTIERQNVMADLDAVTYPVLTLPPEITSEIFSLCTHDQHDISIMSRGPLVLANVCKGWRDICLSTCSLWATVWIDESSHADRNIQFRLAFLQRWFSRAGKHPLDLSVITPPSPATARTWSFLAEYSSQWRSLQLSFNQSSSDSLPVHLIRGNIPSLVELTLSVWCNSPLWSTVFQDAPSLRAVRLSNCSQLWISLPWSQLTYLQFADGSPSAFAKILQEVPNLEILEVSCRRDDSAESPDPVLLSRLHTFKFGFAYSSDTTLFDYITLPGVQTLDSKDGIAHDAVPRFLELGRRSAWAPRSIRLGSADYALAIQCLRALSSLEVVDIQGYLDDPSNLLPLFESLAADPNFLPALRSITIGGCRGWMPLSSLPEVLAVRWYEKHEGVAMLKTFHLSFLGLEMPEDEVCEATLQLHTLVEDGMDVIVSRQ
ncbi:hypothetical protein C8F04DRAFT_144640 [Mycena alexandri]|uniref:F-box domain-containing protein n=1 Tax=Mycena alexandri TaxID=1745969 RepID=A0AAD6X759_9AGAR|nr:hypothetical protein C8F04DRAFT_144640 [Mycena alexandri]